MSDRCQRAAGYCSIRHGLRGRRILREIRRDEGWVDNRKADVYDLVG